MQLSLLSVFPVLLLWCIEAQAHGLASAGLEQSGKQTTKTIHLAQSDGSIQPQDLTFIDMPEMIFNYQSGLSIYRSLQFALVIEVADEESGEVVQDMMSEILDSLHQKFRYLPPDDFAKPDGVYHLKNILFTQISDVIQPTTIQDVLIQRLIVQ